MFEQYKRVENVMNYNSIIDKIRSLWAKQLIDDNLIYARQESKVKFSKANQRGNWEGVNLASAPPAAPRPNAAVAGVDESSNPSTVQAQYPELPTWSEKSATEWGLFRRWSGTASLLTLTALWNGHIKQLALGCTCLPTCDALRPRQTCQWLGVTPEAADTEVSE